MSESSGRQEFTENADGFPRACKMLTKQNNRPIIHRHSLKILWCQDQGYSTDLLDPTQVESKNTFSQIQWPVPSINAESVDIFLGEE